MTQLCNNTMNQNGPSNQMLLLSLLFLVSCQCSLAFTINRPEIKSLFQNVQPLRNNDVIENALDVKQNTILSMSTTRTADETETDDSFQNYTTTIADKIQWLDSDDVISKQIEDFSHDDENSDIDTIEDTAAILTIVDEESENIQQLSKPYYRRSLSELERTLLKLAEQAGAWTTTPAQAIKLSKQAETMWLEAYAAQSVDANVHSFNTVLKAWSKCCHILAYHKQRGKNKKGNSKSSVKSPSTSFALNERLELDMDLSIPESVDTNESLEELLSPTQVARRVNKLLMTYLKQSTTSTTDESNDDGDDDDEQHQNDNTHRIIPDTRSFNIVMHAWATCENTGLERVESLFRKMQDPKKVINNDNNDNRMPFRDSVTYDAVVEATINSNVPDRRDRLYQIWKELCAPSSHKGAASVTTVRPNIRILNSILRAFSRPSKAESDLAYAMSHTIAKGEETVETKYAKLADDMFSDMLTQFQQTKDIDDHPDSVSYTLLMECWSMCGSDAAARRADVLFHDLKRVQRERSDQSHPKSSLFQASAYTYITLMKAWSRASGATTTGFGRRRVEELLEEFLQHGDDSYLGQQHYRNLNFLHHMDTGFMRNTAFIAVLQSWANSRDFVPNQSMKVVELLKRMKTLATTAGDPTLNPSLKTYNTAIDVCGRCHYMGKGPVGTDAGKNKEDSPSSLESIAKQKLAALQIAFAILRAIDADNEKLKKQLNTSATIMQPNYETYAKLLKVVEALLPPGEERNKVAKAVFNKAITAGQVDLSVVRTMQKAADVSLLQEFFAPSSSTLGTARKPLDDNNRQQQIQSFVVQRKDDDSKPDAQSTSSSLKGNYPCNVMQDIPMEWRKNVMKN